VNDAAVLLASVAAAVIAAVLSSAVVAALVGHFGERARDREERRQTRLAETYLAAIQVVLAATDYAERTLPTGSYIGNFDAPTLPSDDEQRQARARLAAYGSSAIQTAYDQFLGCFQEFLHAVARYELLREKMHQLGAGVLAVGEVAEVKGEVESAREDRLKPAGHTLMALANAELAERRAGPFSWPRRAGTTR
jgi:hypothetical protein